MRHRSFTTTHISTPFVRLDTKKCRACWKCQGVCTNEVIGRIDLPWHKHIRFNSKKTCTGCLKCVRTCETNALSKIIEGITD